jgi:hypothetical protein
VYFSAISGEICQVNLTYKENAKYQIPEHEIGVRPVNHYFPTYFMQYSTTILIIDEG